MPLSKNLTYEFRKGIISTFMFTHMIPESNTLAPGIEEHYIALIEAMPTISHLFKVDSPRFTIVASTPRLFQQTGTTKEAVVGKGVFEAFPSNTSDPNDTGESNLRASLLHVLSHKEPHQLPIQRYDIMDDQGHFVVRYWRAENRPVFAPTGEVIYILHTAEDITERAMSEQREEAHQELQQAYKKIEESQQRFLSLANSITQLAWIADEAGWIYWYNDRWYDYTGTTLEEMKGWGWEKVHHPDHIESVVSFVKEAWQKDETWELVFPLRRHDGEYRWFLTRGVPVHDNAGKVIQWIGTNTDIQDQKQVEALLEQRVQERTLELERRNKELEQFTYVSHHDLQEPLRKIFMFTDLIQAEAVQKLSEASLSRLQKVSDSALRMRHALTDVLDYASLNKTEQFDNVDLNEVLLSVQSDLELVISEKKATINYSSLPIIKGVYNQLHQLLYNLINNSLKFSRPEVTPAIVISSSELQAFQLTKHKDLDQSLKYHILTIQDNGIGFRQQYASTIFDIFQRLHSRKEFAGTGIGLALAKKVVSNHGGEIWAEGKEGEGAWFHIILPAND